VLLTFALLLPSSVTPNVTYFALLLPSIVTSSASSLVIQPTAAQQEWAACDECSQWRSLALGAPAWGNMPFRCSMVSWSAFNACTIPEEVVGDQQQQELPLPPLPPRSRGVTPAERKPTTSTAAALVLSQSSATPALPAAPPSAAGAALAPLAPPPAPPLLPLPRGGDFECIICVEDNIADEGKVG
jgi:hypothetical protein